MLQKQVVSLAMTKGVDTKSDSKQQVPGSLVLLENGRFTEVKKIIKRPGYDALSQSVLGGGSLSTGRGVTSFMDELLVSSGTELYSFSEGSEAYVDKGPLFNLKIATDSVTRNDYQQTSQDSCYHASGLECFVWEDSSGGSRYSIIDYFTKLQIVSNRLLASDATKPKAYAIGNYIVILYHDTSEAHLKMLAIPVASPTSAGVLSDAASDILNDVYDAVVISSRIFFVYNNLTGGINVRYINPFLVISSAKTLAANTATSVAIFSDSATNVWVSFWNGTVVKAIAYNYALNTTPLAVTTIETVANVKNITGSVVGTQATIYYDITNATPYNYLIRQNTVTLSAVVGTPSVFIRSLSLGSKSFVYNDQIYVVGSYASTYQPTYFLLNAASKVAAKISPLSGGGIAAKNVIPQINTVSAGIYQMSYLQKNTTTAVEGVIVSQSGVQQATIDFTMTGLISTELANNLLIGGGYLSMYDGASVVEHGYHVFPEQPSLVASAGGSVDAGVHQYVVCYEWMDNFGNIHRSAPSIPAEITITGGTQTVTVSIPTLRVTAKQSVTLVVYRTEAAGTTFYRVSSLTSPTFNSTSVDTVNFVDTASDASIIGNNQLYTTGGEVENISSPATEIFTNYKNRVIVVPQENRSQWWYSKQVIPGLPVEFSDIFVNNMDQYGGDITAVGVLDDKLVFFKENTKMFVYGNGPAANGSNNDFSNPERVTGDTGCTNQRSIVSTPMGLMYQSPKGIYLLDRSLSDKYIGAPVESYTNNAQVRSAVLMASYNQVRFVMTSGLTIVYDYFVDQWSIDTGLNAQDSTLWQGSIYSIIRSSGQALTENALVNTDAGNFVALKLKTGWISFAQVQGYQRLWKMLILGEYLSKHRLIVSFAGEFDETPFQQTYIDGDLSTGVYGEDSPYGEGTPYGGEFPLYQFRVFLTRQKIESVQVTIEDTQTSPYGEGYSISNIAFEVGVKKGADKLRAANSYG